MQKASKQDITQIMAIIKTVVQEMKLENNTQWDDNYPKADNFLQDIEKESLYLDKEDGLVRGLICLDFNQPSEYKLIPWKNNEKAMVIHRMAVNPNCRNQGIAKKMMAFAETLATENEVKHLRTDTYSLNVKMNALFTSLGYHKAGEMPYRNQPFMFNCYEKQIG